MNNEEYNAIISYLCASEEFPAKKNTLKCNKQLTQFIEVQRKRHFMDVTFQINSSKNISLTLMLY